MSRRDLLMILIALACSTGIAAPAPGERPREQTVMQRLLRIAGLTAAPSQLRGPDDAIKPGNLWISNLVDSSRSPLTADGGYSSPVFARDGAIYALKGTVIVRILRPSGGPVEVQKVEGVQKLVGFDDTGDELIVLLEPPRAGSPLGAVSLKTGTMVAVPFRANSDDERRMLAQMRGHERVYGDTTVYTKAETKSGISRTLAWTDVYVRTGAQATRNVSLCDGDRCTQPALAPDGRVVVYVRSDE
jgi:hypothetical protein